MTELLNKAIDQFILSYSASKDIPTLNDSLTAFLDSSAVSMMSYYCLAPIGAKSFSSKNPVMIYGFHENLTDAFQHKYYTAVEILLRSDFAFETPIEISDSRYVSIFNTDQREFFKLLEQHGFKHLHVIRTYGPRDYRGAAFLGFDEKEVWEQTVTLSKIQGVFQAWHVRFIKMYQAKLPSITLTEREHQVMYWVCMGKSNSVIAELMGVSSHTINGYVRRIFLKLGVNDRVSASLVAQAMDLLSPSKPHSE